MPIGNNRVKSITAFGTSLLDVDFNRVGNVQVDRLQPFQNGLAVFTQKKRVGVMDEHGAILLPATFHHLTIHPGYIITSTLTQGKEFWTLYNPQGKRLTTKAYDRIEPFNGTVYPVQKNGYDGGIDTQGKEIIACVYDSLLDALENLVAIKFKGAYGIITINEEWKITPQPNPIKLLNSERYFEFADNLTFLKSINGSTIYFTSNPIEFKDNNSETISSGGKWIINLDGQIIHREQPHAERNEEIFPASEGYRGIKKNGKYGFIDDMGRLRIANRYEDILPFQEALAAVKIRGKWGYINKEDKIAIQPVFEEVSSFTNGYALVKQNGKWAYGPMVSGFGCTIQESYYCTG